MRDRAGRLVGRDRELATLDQLLADLRDGIGGEFVLVSGEAGIGKSTLLAELARRAEATGLRPLRGGGWEGEAPSYWPWRQVLRALRDHDGTIAPLDSGPAARLLDGTIGLGRRDSDFDLYDAVARAIVARSRRTPVVVLLDDLQWADDGSLRLLSFVRAVSVGEALLLVGAYRDDEPSPALQALASGAVSLPLTGLDHSAVVTLMTDVAGPRPTDELATEVGDRCHGNPFFVRETTRLAFTSHDGWVDSIDPSGLPAGVRAVVRRRLDQVTPACRRMLSLLAVAGEGVDEGLIVSASGDPQTAALLDEAQRARIVTADGRRFGFMHDLFRQVLLADLSRAAVADLHARLAAALAAVVDANHTAAPESRGRLAAHYAAAGDAYVGEALRRSVEAARTAVAPDDACRHYERALSLLAGAAGNAPGRLFDRLDLELGLATARAGAGSHLQAREDLAAVAVSARSEGRPEVLATAALAVHALGARTAPQVLTGLALLEDALASTPEAEVARTAQLQAARSRTLSRISGRQAEALSAALQAAELARTAGDTNAEFDALLAQHDLLWADDGRVTPDHVDQRLALGSELIRVARADPHGERAALAHQLRAAALIELGDPDGLVELTRHCELAQALGTARGGWWARSRGAVLAAIDGRTDDALRLATQARTLGTLMGEPDATGCDQSLRAGLDLIGVDGWDHGVDLPPDDPLWRIRHVLSAAHALAGGDLPTTQAEVSRGLPPDDAFYSLDLIAIAAWVWSTWGPDHERERLLGRLEPWSGRHLVVGGCASYFGPADRLRGDLASALGRHHEAARCYDAARDSARRLGALAWNPPRRDLDNDRVVLSHDGATWQVTYQGRTTHLPDAKGLRDLATLIANPGQDVHVLTLLGRPGPATGADPVLDDQARAAYRTRLAAIDAELDRADRAGDAATGEGLATERAALIAELANATGLGGRARRLGDESERARKTVGARIRDSLRRIDEVDPDLGRHLRESTSIGTACRYSRSTARPDVLPEGQR